MAKAEFFYIKLNDNDNDLIKLIQDTLSQLSINDKFCMKKHCNAMLNEFIINQNSCTFDFSKYTDKIINSATISNPLENIDTLKQLNNYKIINETYTDLELKKIIEISSKFENDKLIEELINNEMDNYKIYKILIDNKDLLTEEEINIFYRKSLKRFEKEEIFFNISKIKNKYILIFQNISTIFTINHLKDYLNGHLLLNTSLEINFDKIYDSKFYDILKHSDLTEFKLHINGKEKSLLENEDLTEQNFIKNAISYFKGALGDNLVISSVAKKNEPLNNNKLQDNFIYLRDQGLLNECEIKRKGDRKFISSNDIGHHLSYTESITINTLKEANEFFLRAIEEKQEILER